MKRSPRLAALMAALMLMSMCVAVTPSWALGGPIKNWGPETIGEPGVPDGSGHAVPAPPGGFAVVPLSLMGSTIPTVTVVMLMRFVQVWRFGSQHANYE